MVFSTPVFMFGFLTIVLTIYYVVPMKWRNAVLLCSSLFFYYWGEQNYTIIMIVSTIIDYTHGWLVECFKKWNKDKYARITVASSIFFNLSILFAFKYWDFLATTLQNMGITCVPMLEISLPIGISFYTFQTMSYTIDVYRGDAKRQKSIIRFGTFVTLFPQLIAGPIIKYKDVGEQIDSREHNMERFAHGVLRFMIGMAKKLLIANNIGQLWDTYKNMHVSEMSVIGAWLGIIAFSLQIYFDFSGYSDMAIGLGRMFGFEFMENFNYPYISKSITEFWRRWHISLSTWFREYLYIPLGGNRCSKRRWIFNLFIVWSATGIWHGASWNYLIWGLFFFTILLIEKLWLGKLLLKLQAFWQHIYTIFVLLISWTIFAIEDFRFLHEYIKGMFGLQAVPVWNSMALYHLSNYGVIIILAIFFATPASKIIWEKRNEKTKQILTVCFLILGLIVCTAYLVASTYNPFLYFRF